MEFSSSPVITEICLVSLASQPNELVTLRATAPGAVVSGEVTVIDVRPAAEFEAGHLPAAISVPLDELEERLHELPRDREVVAYCRGPYCVMSFDAMALLQIGRAHV